MVTGPNAPGGIFNYISRTGRTNEGVELSGRVGLLGNGRNPYYRADAYAGGRLAENLFYAVGGFYRWDRGARDPGYAFNRGGQVKGDTRPLSAMVDALARRDARDASRAAAPMAQAVDAVRLDTTDLDIAQAAEAARRIVAQAHARWSATRG